MYIILFKIYLNVITTIIIEYYNTIKEYCTKYWITNLIFKLIELIIIFIFIIPIKKISKIITQILSKKTNSSEITYEKITTTILCQLDDNISPETETIQRIISIDELNDVF